MKLVPTAKPEPEWTAMAGSIGKYSILMLFIIFIQGCIGSSFLNPDLELHPSRFTYDGQARTVCIAGDFNNWSPDTHCLQELNGRWSIRLMLPLGTHRYAFIIDGRRWIADPKAVFNENDGFGRINSLTVIN